MKKLCFKVLLGSLLIYSLTPVGAMEFKPQQHNDFQIKQKEIGQKKDIYFNYSLMNIIPAMKNFGYKADFIDIDSEGTKDDGSPMVENEIVKTTKKKGVKFTKNGIHMATFPIDKSVPSDHNFMNGQGVLKKRVTMKII